MGGRIITCDYVQISEMQVKLHRRVFFKFVSFTSLYYVTRDYTRILKPVGINEPVSFEPAQQQKQISFL